MNIPTLLTLLRILAIPLIVIVYFLPYPWAHAIAAVLFVLTAITDWLDGYLARIWSQDTPLGAFLDPVADKLLVTTVLVVIVSQDVVPYIAFPAAVIVGREIAISALREWMAEIGKRRSVAVSFVGKVKTTFQLVAMVLLLWVDVNSPGWMLLLGGVLLYISAGLTLWSMFVYLRYAWPDLKT